MAQLYPPIIEGTLPAVAEDAGSAILTVSFIMNKAVSKTEIGKMKVQIKSSGLDNKIIGTATSKEINANYNEVQFDLSDLSLTVGQFYKAQVAYEEKVWQTLGYYSTVGVFKYTSKPIVQLVIDKEYGFEGIYSNEDKTEKIYSYNFKLESLTNKWIETSEKLLYDNINSPKIYWKPSRLLASGQYKITLQITTINGLKKDITKDFEILESEINLQTPSLFINENEENAYIKLLCEAQDRDDANIQLFKVDQSNIFEILTNCNFYYRYKLKYFFGNEIGYIYSTIETQILYPIESWYDETIQGLGPWQIEERYKIFDYSDINIANGKLYKYGVNYIFNNDNTVKMFEDLENNQITTYFEHSYLFDGERQLKIKYNPKISSFKPMILEQKTNTMGGKFPFFYTNGNVNYKEFPISGLLSYLSDEEGLFDPKYATINLINRDKTQSESNEWNSNISSTQLTSENIELERQFKMEVLDFLTSGKPMLFRSPTEGNYIVRLSNVSLSPNDTLGRMLHTFSATATECAEYNIENLKELGLAIKEV